MNLKDKFEKEQPGVVFFEQQLDAKAVEFLRNKNWLHDEEEIQSVEKPGEGNMNFVLRLVSNQRRFILKQSRPWVQKFPQVEAPIARIHVEYNFYRFIAPHQGISQYTPEVLGFDPENFILLMEDLGKGADYTYLYQQDRYLSEGEVKLLVDLLSTLHRVEIPSKNRQYLDNQSMKRLNHEHVFVYPFAHDNGLDLDGIQEGLHAVAAPYKEDTTLHKHIARLGDIYLQEHNTLLHGDYYPGSWLRVDDGLKLIDPEFSHLGRAEFDLGVMLAHLKMSQHADAVSNQVLASYRRPDGFDEGLLNAFVGIEIMRRVIGLAQLPLTLSLEQKELLLSESADLIKQYA